MSISYPTINWNNIREHNNSQERGFEELVCILARRKFALPNHFIRKGPPDAGVEAFYVNEDGTEWGWQAKYFTTSLTSSQWVQVKESFITAVNAHPHLSQYFVCIPVDRSDARKNQQKSSLTKWNDFVNACNHYIHQIKHRRVNIVYWGNAELTNMLIQNENFGLIRYFFQKDFFDLEWFSSKVIQSIKNLGPRYTPTLNYHLPLAHNFEALRRTPDIRNEIKVTPEKLIEATRDVLKILHEIMPEEVMGLSQIIFEIRSMFENEQLEKGIDLEACSKKLDILQKQTFEIEKKAKACLQNPSYKQHESYLKSLLYDLGVVSHKAYKIENTLEEPLLNCYSKPCILLTGDAGIGKSHLLADIASNCVKDNISCILLLGQHFSNELSPWFQINQSLLCTSCQDEREFLTALDCVGKIHKQRILFIIDAINEGKAGCTYWQNHIAGFINDFSRYHNIALVLSIRTSYLDCIPALKDEITSKNVVKINHHGFDYNNIHQITSNYFDHYNLSSICYPILAKEFTNPLFLKLFCEYMSNGGVFDSTNNTKITFVFQGFLDNLENKVEEKLGIDQHFRICNKLLDKIAKYCFDACSYGISFEKIVDMINEHRIPLQGIKPTAFLDELVSLGALTIDVGYNCKGEAEEIYRFSYERLQNYKIAELLISGRTKTELRKVFDIGGDKEKFLFDDGILEMLSILIPEKLGIELIEVIPYASLDEYEKHRVIRAYTYSLQWRTK